MLDRVSHGVKILTPPHPPTPLVPVAGPRHSHSNKNCTSIFIKASRFIVSKFSNSSTLFCNLSCTQNISYCKVTKVSWQFIRTQNIVSNSPCLAAPHHQHPLDSPRVIFIVVSKISCMQLSRHLEVVASGNIITR